MKISRRLHIIAAFLLLFVVASFSPLAAQPATRAIGSRVLIFHPWGDARPASFHAHPGSAHLSLLQQVKSLSKGLWDSAGYTRNVTPQREVALDGVKRSLTAVPQQLAAQVRQVKKTINASPVVTTGAQQVGHLRKAGEIAQELGKMSAKVCAVISKSFNDVKGLCGGNNKNVSGTDKPGGAQSHSPVEGKQIVWVNDQGDVIIPKEAQYNPNDHSVQHWHKVVACTTAEAVKP